VTDSPGRHFILCAAGHVDHGKTALITALTGVNTDRLKEEQERGISIELGFAEFAAGDDLVLGVVDMPGHERFVKQMVAGSGGVDLAFLVVAADEGVMPQTVEHLEILDSLGVASGVVVMTKIDLVDEDILAVATAEARELVAGTFLADKPIVPVSATAGLGLTELTAALRREADLLPVRQVGGPFRLPLDRVFTLPGVGAIVTGTCWAGSVKVGDRLVIEPAGLKVRVREVQAHGRATAAGFSGQRLALALHGAKKEDLQRGYQVLSPGCCQPSRRIDVRVQLLPHYRGQIKNRQRLHVHHAGREVLGRIVLLDEADLGRDTGPRTCLAQLHLEDSLVPQRGDRLVLRFYSPVTSVAGAVILDCSPRRHKRFDESVLEALSVREEGDPDALFEQRLQAAGLAGLPVTEAGDFSESPQAVTVADRLYHRQVLAAQAEAVAALVADYGRKYPLRLGIPKEEARRKVRFPGSAGEWNGLCRVMADLGGWFVAGDKITASATGPALPPELARALDQRAEALRELGLQWPGTAAFGEQHTVPADHKLREEEFLRFLADQGKAVQVAADYFVHAEVLAETVAALGRFFQDQPEIGFGEFRELTGLTRKLGIPLLEYLDQIGVTERVGDKRRPGPALAEEK